MKNKNFSIEGKKQCILSINTNLQNTKKEIIGLQEMHKTLEGYSMFSDRNNTIECEMYVAEHSKNTCCKCLENDGRIYWPSENYKKLILPLHPNCKCHYVKVLRQRKNKCQRFEVFSKIVLRNVIKRTLIYAKTKIGIKYGTLKCNSFIMEIFNIPNGTVIEGPYSRYLKIVRRNPSAKEFYYGEVEGFTEVTDPRPGDICADTGIGKIEGHGHVGIVSGPGMTISASSVTGTIVENDWGFRRPENINARFFRYVGNPKLLPRN